MPLIIPKTLPAYDALYEENVFVMHRERAASQHIRPLEILILNLMPTKIATETQIARLLANTPLQVHMTLLQTASHAATHVSAAHLDAFYKTFDEVKKTVYGNIEKMGTDLLCGRVAPFPAKGGGNDPCGYCPYAGLCNNTDPDAPHRELGGKEKNE